MEESKTKDPTKTFAGKEKPLRDSDIVDINIYLSNEVIKSFTIEVK